MADEKKVIHVSHVGENREVEDERATLGQTETQSEAIELAAELAPEAKAELIDVHSSDGRVERQISVNPPADAREGGREEHRCPEPSQRVKESLPKN